MENTTARALGKPKDRWKDDTIEHIINIKIS